MLGELSSSRNCVLRDTDLLYICLEKQKGVRFFERPILSTKALAEENSIIPIRSQISDEPTKLERQPSTSPPPLLFSPNTRKTLAGVSESGYDRNSNVFLFGVSITLTDQGLAEGFGMAAVGLLFQYLDLLAKTEPKECVSFFHCVELVCCSVSSVSSSFL